MKQENSDGIYLKRQYEGETVQLKVDRDADVYDVCTAFQDFLHTCGYSKNIVIVALDVSEAIPDIEQKRIPIEIVR